MRAACGGSAFLMGQPSAEVALVDGAGGAGPEADTAAHWPGRSRLGLLLGCAMSTLNTQEGDTHTL